VERVSCRERVVEPQGGVVAIVVSFTQERVAGGISQKRVAAVAHSKIVAAFGTGNSRQKLLHCWIGGHSRGLEDVHFSHLSRQIFVSKDAATRVLGQNGSNRGDIDTVTASFVLPAEVQFVLPDRSA